MTRSEFTKLWESDEDFRNVLEKTVELAKLLKNVKPGTAEKVGGVIRYGLTDGV